MCPQAGRTRLQALLEVQDWNALDQDSLILSNFHINLRRARERRREGGLGGSHLARRC